MFGVGFTEILVILAVALIVLGPDKLPEAGMWLGKLFRQYKIARDDLKSRIDTVEPDAPVPSARPTPAAQAPQPSEAPVTPQTGEPHHG